MAEGGQIVCNGVEKCGIVLTSLVKQILVPYDNSGHAMRAFCHAMDLAKKYGASITIITITDEDQNAEWVNDTPTRQKTINTSRNAEFRRIFKDLEAQATKFGIHFDSMLVESTSPAESIISIASMRKMDYIVMGTHGKGKTKEMMLGRVSTNVALNAHCPVVLIK